MAVSVEKISNVVGKNPPGLKRLWIAALSDVETIPAHTDYVISAPIVLVTDKEWVELEFSRQAGATFNVEEAESEDTTGYNYTIEGFIGGLSAAQNAALDKLANNPVVCLCQWKDDAVQVAGQMGRGMRFRVSQEGGLNAGTRRGVTFSAVMDFGNLPYFYTGTLPS